MSRLSTLALIACLTAPTLFLYAYFSRDVYDVEAIGSKRMIVMELGEGAGVAQLFTFPRNGLRSIAVAVWSAAPLDIDLEFELRRRPDLPGAPDLAIAHRVTTIAQPAGEAWHTVDVPVVADSKAATFVGVFRVRKVTGAPTGGPATFGLVAWADDALPSGRLFVGSRERWGDLAFAAQAAPRTRFQRVVEALEGNLSATGRLWLASLSMTVFYWALVVLVAVSAVSGLHRRATSGSATATPPGQLASIGALLLAAGTPVLAIGVAIATRERVAVDLLQELDAAAMESPAPLHEAFALVEEPINGVKPRALFAHPPGKVSWMVTVPEGGATLRTAMALRPPVWENRSDGVTFSISVADGSHVAEAYSLFVNPRERLDHRAWIPVDVNLSAYAGRSVRVILETTPGPSGNGSFDWAMWGHPRIVVGLAGS